MEGHTRIKLFDFGAYDLVFFVILIALALWLFIPGLGIDRIMLPYPDTLYTDTEIASKITYNQAFLTGSDVNLMFQPWIDYSCERLKDGRIPFWNPYNLCGTPFYANSLNQMTYIPRIIFSLILPSENVLTALALLHFLLTGIGTYYLLKAYGVSQVAAGIAAFVLLFKFSHPTVMMMSTQALSLAYMPLCLLIAVKIIRGGRWLFALYLAICLGAVFSSGYPVFSIHMLYLGFALIVYECFRLRKTGKIHPWSGFPRVIAATILGLLFSLPQVLPLTLLNMLSARPSMFMQTPFHFDFHYSFPALILFQNLLFPGPGLGYPFTAPPTYSNLYLGIAAIMLLLPVYGQWRNPSYRFFLIASVITALPCLSTTIFLLSTRFIPGLGLSPVPPFPALFFCMVGALGLTIDHILKNENILTSLRTTLLILFVILAATAPPVYKVVRGEPENFVLNYAAYLASMLVILLLVLTRQYRNKNLIAAVVIIVFALNFLPPMKKWISFFGPEESNALACHKTVVSSEKPDLNRPRYFVATGSALMAANINVYSRTRFVQGYDGLVLKHFVNEYSKHIPEGVWRGRRLVTGKNEIPYEYLRKAGVGKVILDPASGVDGVREDICGSKLLIDDSGYAECTSTYGNCSMLRINPERIVITSDSPEPTVIVVAETFYPAWRYRVTGDPHLYNVEPSADGFLKISDIPAGKAEIALFYHPWFEILGLALGVFSFISGLIIILWMDRGEVSTQRVKLNKSN